MAPAIKLFQSASSGLIVAIGQPGVNLLIVWEDFRTLRGRFGLFHDAPSRGKSHTMCKFSPTPRANLHFGPFTRTMSFLLIATWTTRTAITSDRTGYETYANLLIGEETLPSGMR